LQRQHFTRFFLKRYLRGDSESAPHGPFSKEYSPKTQRMEYVDFANMRKRRDQRFFHLFLATCEPSKVPVFLLQVLERQLHSFPSPLFLSAFSSPSIYIEHVGHFRSLLEHLPATVWHQQQNISFICSQIRSVAEVGTWSRDAWEVVNEGRPALSKSHGASPGAPDTDAVASSMVGMVLELLQASEFRKVAGQVIMSLLDWGHLEKPFEPRACQLGADESTAFVPPQTQKSYSAGELLTVPGVQEQIAQFISSHFGGKEARGLWIKFFQRAWQLEQQDVASCKSDAILQGLKVAGTTTNDAYNQHFKEMVTSQPLVSGGVFTVAATRCCALVSVLPDCPVDQPSPLTQSEVASLAVDHPARQLLVVLSPALAVKLHGKAILDDSPSFGTSLSDELWEELKMNCLKPKSTKTSAERKWMRRVLKETSPVRALPLAIELLAVSQGEDEDIQMVKEKYLQCSRLTRRQVCLLEAVGSLWAKVGTTIQKEVVEAALCSNDRDLEPEDDLGEMSLGRMDIIF